MNQTPISLPGISEKTLHSARIHHVDAAAAFELCGRRTAGIIFPYLDLHGNPIEDGDGSFVRLRLDEPQDGPKYHQRAGSRVHAFLTPKIREDEKIGNPLIIIEGEKKALALSDAGFCAVGIAGFYGFHDRSGALVPELIDVLALMSDPFVIFVGDNDVVFNAQFANAATKLKKLLPRITVMACCVPIDAPGKGIDDCREALGNRFNEWWLRRQLLGRYVEMDSTPGALALALLKPQIAKLGCLGGDDLLRKIAKLAAGLGAYPLELEQLVGIAEKHCGQGRALVKRVFRQVAKDRATSTDALGPEFVNAIDVGQQAALWTTRLLEIIGPATYLYGGNLCDYGDGKFAPHTPASLVSFCDDPQRCSFIQTASDGSVKTAQFSESLARIAMGALRKNLEKLRQVEVVSPVPVLAWTGRTVEVVEGYNKELRILAGIGRSELPTPEEAAQRILDALRDFDFPSDSDAGRAVAFLLTPALTIGRFLDSGRAPFFMIEKDQCGAGGGTLVRLGAAIYGLKPASITPDQPKAAREDVSKHLLGGANYIYFDNVRGRILSHLEFLESLLTEPVFTYRAPYCHGEIGVEKCVFACTSNGAVLSPDLADRTIKITITKRPDAYRFYQWPHGSLIDHVAAERFHYLGAVYALVKAWATAGRPDGTRVTGFRFTRWETACAWILERYFPGLPLLDSEHKVAQHRMANPDFDVLRTVLRMALERRSYTVMASSLADLAVEAGLVKANGKGAALHMGRLLKKEFPTEGEFEFAGEFRVRRCDVMAREQNYEKVTQYVLQPLKTGPERMPTFPAARISKPQPVAI